LAADAVLMVRALHELVNSGLYASEPVLQVAQLAACHARQPWRYVVHIEDSIGHPIVLRLDGLEP
jgi:hypothetical protein